ncbi:hypothetical protein [Yersinia mollaretii]|uniref:hypothetical protein n=2 Tax=Yersinia mollaretii TaxID=33060 RepID=UPI0005E9CE40|nr:hypothetical protein [Yersinia mollaretii]MDA5529027.1 hypothetical protein [Yersinia mollaretii]MDR7875732.1 hypothetical protein [Yersinia mollaretii]PHZ29664.1 hypothetical protein CS537_21415 [Yersinia mollaretii]WQC75144.1 hypothetical protein U1Z61_00910 [Yersinia mollaretii]CNF68282.1 Uncharacterised protein [Yersinia mollaretii]
MNIINDQVESVNPDISSTPLPGESAIVKVNDGHLVRILSDMEKISENDKAAISQLSGSYQENSDGTFHSYSTEETNADGTNKVKITVEAKYSSGNISGYTVQYTEYDMAGNLLGSAESELDADGTTIDLPNDDPTVGLNKTEGEVVSQIVTDSPVGKEGQLIESINSFPLYGEELVSVLMASNIMVRTALASVIICVP